MGIIRERPTYNFGFGTLNLENGAWEDSDISGNGDAYKVFNTVLNTIPYFLQYFPDAMVMVEGSDSDAGYPEFCRLTCRKKCTPPACRNHHRRINLYKAFLNKNYDFLSERYKFYGGMKSTNNQYTTEDYLLANNYKSIFFIKI